MQARERITVLAQSQPRRKFWVALVLAGLKLETWIFNSDSSKWLRCGEQGLVPDGLRRIVQLAWSSPQVRSKQSLFVKHVQCLCGTGGVKTW